MSSLDNMRDPQSYYKERRSGFFKVPSRQSSNLSETKKINTLQSDDCTTFATIINTEARIKEKQDKTKQLTLQYKVCEFRVDSKPR